MATIVLADDSDELRTVYAESLRLRGHTVYEAADGDEAIALVRATSPDLLVLDVWMPNRNGLEVLDALRYDPEATRLQVAMLSVLGDGDVQLKAFSGGAIAYLVKGMPLAEFLAKVDALLARRAANAPASGPS